MTDTQSMCVTSVGRTREDIETKTELSDPSQTLVVQRLEYASFDLIEGDVAVNVVKDDFFHPSPYRRIAWKTVARNGTGSLLPRLKASPDVELQCDIQPVQKSGTDLKWRLGGIDDCFWPDPGLARCVFG